MTDRTRDKILNTARTLISGDREADYGSAKNNFTNIAKKWSVTLGVDVTASQVAICMADVKTCRLINTPSHLDSWIDGCGYLALGGEIARMDDADRQMQNGKPDEKP